MTNFNQSTMIMPDHPDAAREYTKKGFVALDGTFYPESCESTCRWHSATHVYCSECNKPCPKSVTKCDECAYKHKREKWLNKPEVEWDGTGGLYSEAHDRFFFSAGELSDYLEELNDELQPNENPRTERDLMLVICTPAYAPEFDPEEFLQDLLPEDMTSEDVLSKSTWDAMQEFMRCLKAEGPISWNPYGKTRPMKILDE